MKIRTICSALILVDQLRPAPATLCPRLRRTTRARRAKEAGDTSAQRRDAQYEYEPDETPLLASSRRQASALWQPPRVRT